MYKGNKGYVFEEVARRYLIKNGYKILDVNFLCKFGEIDVIAQKDDILAFIEVKGRKNLDFGYPREYVTAHKIKKIIMAAKFYILKHKLDDIAIRFDVIEIILDIREVNHIENAFESF